MQTLRKNSLQCRCPTLRKHAFQILNQAGDEMDENQRMFDSLAAPELNGRLGSATALLSNIAEALSFTDAVTPQSLVFQTIIQPRQELSLSMKQP